MEKNIIEIIVKHETEINFLCTFLYSIIYCLKYFILWQEYIVRMWKIKNVKCVYMAN